MHILSQFSLWTSPHHPAHQLLALPVTPPNFDLSWWLYYACLLPVLALLHDCGLRHIDRGLVDCGQVHSSMIFGGSNLWHGVYQLKQRIKNISDFNKPMVTKYQSARTIQSFSFITSYHSCHNSNIDPCQGNTWLLQFHCSASPSPVIFEANLFAEGI